MDVTPRTTPTAVPPPRWGTVLRCAAARALLATVGSMLVWALVPVVLGWQPHLILTGSMAPSIAPGDVVVTRPVEPSSVGIGQIVTVADPDHPGRTRTHRIARITDDGLLVLKGDANEVEDSSPVSLDSVHGVAVLRVPSIGLPMLWLRSGSYGPLGLFVLALAWSVLVVAKRAGDRPGDPEDQDRDDDPHPDCDPEAPATDPCAVATGDVRVVGQRPRRAATWVAGLMAATLTLLAGGAAPAGAAMTSTTSTPTSTFAAASSFAGYVASVLADAPYLYWRLEETGGTTVADSSPNGRTATLHNTPTFGAAGALPSAPTTTAFRLTTERMTQNTQVTAPSVFSLEVWVRTTTTAGGRILGFGNRNGSTNSTSSDRILYLGNNGRPYFGVGTAKTVITHATALNDGAWHHLVATYSGSGTNGMKLYVDGVLASQGTGSLVSLSGYWRAGGDTMSGWTANPTSSWYNGTVDEVAVYSTALTAAQVAQHYVAAS